MEAAVEGHVRGAADDEPVLSSTGVALVAEASGWPHLDSFDLVGLRVLQDGVRTPRTLVVFAGHVAILPEGREVVGQPGGTAPRRTAISITGTDAWLCR